CRVAVAPGAGGCAVSSVAHRSRGASGTAALGRGGEGLARRDRTAFGAGKRRLAPGSGGGVQTFTCYSRSSLRSAEPNLSCSTFSLLDRWPRPRAHRPHPPAAVPEAIRPP